MNLFRTFNPAPENLLPQQGTALYYGHLLSAEEADHYLQALLETIAWRQDEMIMYGKHIVTTRKVAWFGDRCYEYTYSGMTRTSHVWTPELLELKARVEAATSAEFNSCLLNLYNNGRDGLGWHSDDEEEFGAEAAIASLSLGAARRFLFRHKTTKRQVELILEHGGLLLMKDDTQLYWQHSVPKSAKVHESRVNLTFRRVVN